MKSGGIYHKLKTVQSLSLLKNSTKGLFALEDNVELDDAYWQQILAVRSEINRVLEQARNDKVIGGGLEAEVTLFANDELAQLLNKLGNELRFVSITSKAEVQPLEKADVAEGEVKGLAIKVIRSANHKCPRCWHYSDSANTESLCSRCEENVNGMGEVRKFA